jgi:hypothetical protein
MIRIQVSLPPDEHAAAKGEAARLGISLAEFFRRAIQAALPVDESAPWMHYAGMVETGDPASSQKIDDVVCGRKD